VDAGSGVITTLVGTGTSGFSGDGGPANVAKMAAPVGVSIDSAGNLYISDYSNNRIRKVDISQSILTYPTSTMVERRIQPMIRRQRPCRTSAMPSLTVSTAIGWQQSECVA